MRTRAGAKSDFITKDIGTTIAMGSATPSPLKLLVLPKDVSSGARICTLAHPRTSNPSRYYFCPEKGVFEFIRIVAPKSICQSWLIGPQHRPCQSGNHTNLAQPVENIETSIPGELNSQANSIRSVTEGYVVKSPELLVATPIDPLFLILPSFCGQFSSNKGSSIDSRFISSDDLIERLQVSSKHWDLLSNNKPMRETLDVRITTICDTVEAGGETMYRINLDQLLTELIFKAKNMVASGFPASMEDKFVRKALEAPMMALKREESSLSETPKLSQEAKPIVGPSSDQELSQISIDNTDPKVTVFTASTDLSTSETQDPSLQVLDIRPLLRLHTALSYMISSYIPPPIEVALKEKLGSSGSPIDFKPLDQQLAHIASLRAEALASRSLSDFSRKRSMNEDDEAAESRAEKKQRKEDEEKRRKAGESKGVRDLKKVDVSGMKKMNDFFTKGPAKKKK